MIPLPHWRSLSGRGVQSVARDFLRPEYPPADYRRLRAENLRRASTCLGRPSLRNG